MSWREISPVFFVSPNHALQVIVTFQAVGFRVVVQLDRRFSVIR
jgi:hypothetical protein